MNLERFRTSMVTALMVGMVTGEVVPAAAQDLGTLPYDHPEVTVVGVTGERTTGTLRRFDAATVVLDRDGQDVVFQKPAIAQIYEDDPLKNGMLIGLASGLVLAALTTATADCGGFFVETYECSADERFAIFGFSGAVLGGAGLGVGAAIDALVHRHRVLYLAPPGAGGLSPSRVTLHLDPHGARVSIGIRW